MDCLRNHLLQNGADPVDAPCSLVGCPDLPENGVFAEYHRLETGGDPQQMTDAVLVAGADDRGLGHVGDERRERRARRRRRLGDDVGLTPVTGPQHVRLPHRPVRQQGVDIAPGVTAASQRDRVDVGPLVGHPDTRDDASGCSHTGSPPGSVVSRRRPPVSTERVADTRPRPEAMAPGRECGRVSATGTIPPVTTPPPRRVRRHRVRR